MKQRCYHCGNEFYGRRCGRCGDETDLRDMRPSARDYARFLVLTLTQAADTLRESCVRALPRPPAAKTPAH